MSTSIDLSLPVPTPTLPVAEVKTGVFENDFKINREDLLRVKSHFVEEVKNGLSNASSSLAMLPGYVSSLPTGDEKGKFLLVMIDEATLGVGAVTFVGGRKYELALQKYVVDANARENAKKLFSFVANCLAFLLNELHIPLNSNLPLAASLAFPLSHQGVGKGQVLSFCKGFRVPGLLSRDIGELLFEAFKKKGIVADILTIQNDTITSLLAHAYSVCSQTTIGCFIDSGTNIAYLDSLEQLPKWKSLLGVDKMIFNTECGGFNVEGAQVKRNKFDLKIDEESHLPGLQRFEKMTSGMYIGEIVRLAMESMVLKGVLFGGKLPNDLSTPYLFDFEQMIVMESDKSPDLLTVKRLLKHTLNISTSISDREIVKCLCQQVCTRAASLVGACLAGLIERHIQNDPEKIVSVSLDGRVLHQYHQYHHRLCSTVRDLLGENGDKVRFGLVENLSVGAGVGAMLQFKLRC
ncbi:hypothetical protein K493DRAFT_318405 [Basidiobolus meristosporus CBS 931.73]|uniref:Phosphotransferase n=1 Tax=Basidiobolus meristosporus CBS 931.73 TaxID=1314790 RepID=A0A1Y1XVS6_9FUNG|nr:hypothetical protein K493DRAFT_318405 [Basidiobolus meristosporus CBS 931.73]|eukprot:ORX89823.1 hypothetical protein K493DRAFT_318405 [Basidiobolus meristosporus CBS 931.73]